MRRPLQATPILSLAFLLSACGGVLPPTTQAGPTTDSGELDAAARAGFSETWSEFSPGSVWVDGNVYGRWTDRWNGYGTIAVSGAGDHGSSLSLAPLAAAPWDHSALVTTTTPMANFSASVTLTTRQQFNTAPNPWEVGWVLWSFSDNTHFYAFIPKPNGWELSKQDPAYPGSQRFLATDNTPTFPVGTTYTVSVVQQGASFVVSVNGKQIVQFTDEERPYLGGVLGLYCEEASVDYGAIAMRGTAI
jgi:hypothetical protein